MPIIAAMTPNEVTRRMRQPSIHTTETRIATAIQDGQPLWGICVPRNKHNRCEIYTKLFEVWAAERASQSAPLTTG